MERLETINTNQEEKVKEALGVTGHSLLRELTNSALAYYDFVRKKWIVNLEL